MNLKLRSLFPALALLALSTLNSQLSTASAQGTAFSYSGQLQVSGSPVTGLYDFQFSLSNAPSGGGSQVGSTVAVYALGVTNGLFSTTMDFGPVFSNSPTWLAIGVRPAGSLSFTNLTPLQQILPTPYAVYAETAGYATVLANGVALGTGQANAIDPSAVNSFIGGGFGNNIGAGSTTVTIGGGTLNYATGQYVTVGGGQANRATNDEATVSGGSANNAGGSGATVAGGQDNYASGQFAAVGGGYQNNASGFLATISGGQGNQATDEYTTVGGGAANTASVEYGTVGGGVGNTASGYGTVGGGQGNTADEYNATVGGGINNLASGYSAVVSGGEQNTASGPHAVVGGGNVNFATNEFATVPGGLSNVAGGPYSFAAGFTAQATNDGAFVWADDEGGLPFTSTNNNSFNVRANGGVRFMTGGAGMTVDGQSVLTGSASALGSATPPANVSLVLNMVWIVPGTFIMGSTSSDPDYEPDEGPQTVVTLTNGFWMGQHPVTQGEYLSVMGINPSYFTGDLSRPVEQVTWFNATNFCYTLTQREQSAGRLPVGWVYRLPTEAEWEYCCRALNNSRFYFGDDPGDSASLTNYAWYNVNSGSSTQPVGKLLPNAWGLVDMAGNVWEWCQDGYGAYPGGSVTNPQGTDPSSEGRVIRGGSWDNGANDCRSAGRDGYNPYGSDNSFGFRCVLSPGQ